MMKQWIRVFEISNEGAVRCMYLNPQHIVSIKPTIRMITTVSGICYTLTMESIINLYHELGIIDEA